MKRPAIHHELNEKFIKLGIKKGQETIFDKETADFFGVEEGYTIKFSQHQTFLAKLYADAGIKAEKKVTTEVVL
jgi:hypothetical protein